MTVTTFTFHETQGRVELAGTLTVTTALDTSMQLGVTCSDSNLKTDLVDYPNQRYHRVFGPTVLPRHDSPKMLLLPPHCIPHVSWKTWDAEALATWLDGLRRPVYLTYHHEPHGDIDPAVYRMRATEMTGIIAGHRLVVGHGPIVTRYWLDVKQGNPRDWFYVGATLFGLDAYPDLKTRYRTAEEMFGQGLNTAVAWGVPLLVPEWGMERIATDLDGTGRARAMREHAAYLREHAAAAGWWNFGGDRLYADPERATLQTLVHNQP